MENENHLLLIIILLLAVAAFVVGESNSRFSDKSDNMLQSTSASQSTTLDH